MKLLDLTSRLERLGYVGQGGPYNGSLRHAEPALHELCHAAFLGWCTEKDIDFKIGEMSYVASDWNEIKTLAVEKLVANSLGFKVSTNTLAAYAVFGTKTKRFHDIKTIKREINRLLTANSTRRLAIQVIQRIEGV